MERGVLTKEKELKELEALFSLPNDAPWGLSTWINLYQCDKTLITDEKSLQTFVIELCEFLDVRRFGEPIIIDFGNHERIKGFSLTQLIETSLISAHFVNFNGTAYIDIFSCKFYPPQAAFDFCLAFFKAKQGNFDIKIRN